MVLNHIGFVVNDLHQSKSSFKHLGYDLSGVFIDEIQEIEIMLLNSNSGPIIELIKPTTNNHSLDRYKIKHQNSMPYHIAYETKDITKEIKIMRKYGFIPTMKIGVAVAFDNVPFVFLMNKNTGLIELLETN